MLLLVLLFGGPWRCCVVVESSCGGEAVAVETCPRTRDGSAHVITVLLMGIAGA